MENDGLAYVGEPGRPFAPDLSESLQEQQNRAEDLESGDSGDSSSSNASQTPALGTAAPQPGYEPGSEGMINPDAETHLISMPPVLLVAAYRFMAPINSRLVWVPLLNQLTDEWRQRELTDA
ncbi:hypothetical protein ABBQ32_010814, partial [Trebouxia sp. C0010 RCD-2024]